MKIFRLSQTVFLTFLLISFSALASEKNKHYSSKNMLNFGPGEHYLHKMDVRLSDFKKIKDISKAASDIPRPIYRNQAKKVHIKREATEVISDIAPDISYHYWTFNNTVPGPFLRVREGDTVELSLHNNKTSSHAHAIDLHAVTGPGGGKAVTEVEPGQTKTLIFKASTPGL